MLFHDMAKRRLGRPSKKNYGNDLETKIEAGARELSRQFGAILRQHRQRLGITQEQLAEKADVSLGMIAKIESGTTGVRFPFIVQLAIALGVEPIELFDRTGGKGKAFQGKLRQLQVRLENLSVAELDWAVDVLTVALKAPRR